jgi:hypothetical protein
MSLMKRVFGHHNFTSKRERCSGTNSLRRCRRALALEPLEGRVLLAVSGDGDPGSPRCLRHCF